MMRLTRRECEVEECHMPETPETAVSRNGTHGHRSGPRPGVTEVGRPSVCEYTPARSPCDHVRCAQPYRLLRYFVTGSTGSTVWTGGAIRSNRDIRDQCNYYGCARSCMCDCGTPTDMFVLSSDVTAVTLRRGFWMAIVPWGFSELLWGFKRCMEFQYIQIGQLTQS